MHRSSIIHMKALFERYLAGVKPGIVVEIGSASAKAEFREIFEAGGWEYVGADLGKGNNVSLVLDDPFSWSMDTASADVILSGQMLEHNEMFWLTFIEMARVLAPGGHMFHIAPSRGPEHRAPQDCWRYYRDGMTAIAKWTGLECLEATTDWSAADLAWMRKNKPDIFQTNPPVSKYPGSVWGDTVGVFRKPPGARPELALRYMRELAAKWE